MSKVYDVQALADNIIKLIKDNELRIKIAKTGKPIILSTGIAEEEDIQLALETCRKAGNNNILLMKCTSSYPAPIEETNLLTIPDMKKRYGVRVGLSDHSMGSVVASTAVALGAEMVEKHFILDRRLGGPDAGFSMEPDEFKEMIDRIREVEQSLGQVRYELTERGRKNRFFARSLFFIKDLKAGDVITHDNMKSIRPGNGLHPKYENEIIGRVVTQDIQRGTPVSWNLIKKL